MSRPLDKEPPRAGASVLDRLLDAHPDQARDRRQTASESIDALRRAVHRDVEHLLNARRPWRTPPLATLKQSPLGYGIADFTAGAFNEEGERDKLRGEIADAIRRFEPRLTQVEVRLVDNVSTLRTVLTLHVSALLLIDPMPEPISFDTLIDTTTADVVVRARDGG